MQQLDLAFPHGDLFAIHGPDRVGKTSLAKAAQSLDGRVQILSVGDEIKKKAATSENIDPAQIEQNKEDYRDLLRSVASEGCDLHGADYWINQLAPKYFDRPAGSIVFIDDVRREAEAKWVRQQGGIIISLYREDEYPDPAEREAMLLEEIEPDIIIWNDFRLPQGQLVQKAKDIVWGDALQKVAQMQSAA